MPALLIRLPLAALLLAAVLAVGAVLVTAHGLQGWQAAALPFSLVVDGQDLGGPLQQQLLSSGLGSVLGLAVAMVVAALLLVGLVLCVPLLLAGLLLLGMLGLVGLLLSVLGAPLLVLVLLAAVLLAPLVLAVAVLRWLVR
jgi:hypothetical protein